MPTHVLSLEPSTEISAEHSIGRRARTIGLRRGRIGTLAALPFAALALTAVTQAAVTVAPISTAASLLAAAPLQQGKPDTVFRINAKTNKAQSLTGVVTEDGLNKLKMTLRGDKEQSVDALEVVEVSWGDVPASFSDGTKYAKRGDWEKAVQGFQTAAGDSDARPVVQAAARLRAIEGLLAWGAADPARFADAMAEADRFLVDHAANRCMPKVRALKARAAWLSGDAGAARDGYKALFEAGKGGTEGYAPMLVADAALQAGNAALAADDTLAARELYDLAGTAFGAIESASPRVIADAAAGAEVASLGEARAQLAKGDADSARRTFERAAKENTTSAGKAAARLGLAQALLADGKAIESQVEFAWVAGLDHTSADRRAEALIGLAQAYVAASPTGGAGLAKSALERVRREFGATPSAARAAELLQSM